MLTQTYPSGRQVTLSYDDVGRIDGAAGSFSGSPATYESSFAYAAHGAVVNMTLGNGLAESTQFNSLLQPTQVKAGGLLTLGFNYGSINNGNLISQTITRPGFSATQTYAYDGVNRLDLAQEGASWSRDCQ